MANETEALAALIASARGERPQSLTCLEAEEVLNVTLAVLVELAVTNERIDRLERLMADLSGQSVEQLRDIRYEGDIARQRQLGTDALLTRALRIILDPRARSSRATGSTAGAG